MAEPTDYAEFADRFGLAPLGWANREPRHQGIDPQGSA